MRLMIECNVCKQGSIVTEQLESNVSSLGGYK